MKKALPILLFFSACFLFEDENQNTNLTLSEGAIGVATVRLHVEPEDSLAQFTFELTRDDSTVQTLSLQSDTLIKDTGLNPNTSYTYTGYWMDGTKRIGESNTLTLTTMDTTSHNFTWEIDTLGDYGSYLNDVWIVDENDIWVVGNIETDSMEYNMAHWDGVEWELMGLVSQDEQIGHLGIDPIIENYSSHTLDLYSIHYFSENDIWVLSGYPIHWDGNNWTFYHLHKMGVIDVGLSNGAMWGSSPDNIYFVGRKGTIVHFDGNEFTKMESGTHIDLIDIDGTENGEYIFIVGQNDLKETIVLQIHNDIQTIYLSDNVIPDGDYGIVSSLFVYGDTTYIDTKVGLLKYNYLTETSSILRTDDLEIFDGNRIVDVVRNNTNDYILIGAIWDIFHFNGLNMSLYDGISSQFGYPGAFTRQADFKGNICVVTGYCCHFNHAIVVRGYRQ